MIQCIFLPASIRYMHQPRVSENYCHSFEFPYIFCKLELLHQRILYLWVGLSKEEVGINHLKCGPQAH